MRSICHFYRFPIQLEVIDLYYPLFFYYCLFLWNVFKGSIRDTNILCIWFWYHHFKLCLNNCWDFFLILLSSNLINNNGICTLRTILIFNHAWITFIFFRKSKCYEYFIQLNFLLALLGINIIFLTCLKKPHTEVYYEHADANGVYENRIQLLCLSCEQTHFIFWRVLL